MNISNDSAPVDYVEYIVKQLPADLVKLTKLRDEIAKRQGALTAVDAAIKLKDDADEYSATIKAASDKLAAEAKEIADVVKAKKKELDSREKNVEVKEKAHFAAVEAHAKSSRTLDESLVADRAVLNNKAAALEAAAKNLAIAEAAHATRVRAFQDKVAQITA
jgi:beta-N-acetylglucosaminidase